MQPFSHDFPKSPPGLTPAAQPPHTAQRPSRSVAFRSQLSPSSLCAWECPVHIPMMKFCSQKTVDSTRPICHDTYVHTALWQFEFHVEASARSHASDRLARTRVPCIRRTCGRERTRNGHERTANGQRAHMRTENGHSVDSVKRARHAKSPVFPALNASSDSKICPLERESGQRVAKKSGGVADAGALSC
jgi:hypothetical protein